MPAAEEFDPKKRLVGAAILIGIAVVLLPMILDNDDALESTAVSGQDEPIQGLSNDYVSSEEEVTVFVSKITPIDENAGSIDNGSEQQAVAAATPAPKPDPVPQPKPEVKPALEAEPSPEPSDSVERGWVVRIGTFANAANVEKVLADLKSKGFTPDSESIETSKGMATRIWIGPYSQRVEAARARTSLEQQTGEPGLITAFP